ncbi:uncharacterized protein [Littorina saxatilis]
MQDQFAVTTQPGSHGVQVYVSPEEVTVRTMRADDCDFAGRLLIDGFKEKFVHAIGAGNLELARRASAADHRMYGNKYDRIFIAEFEGRRAGVMELKFYGNSEGSSSDHWDALGCCTGCRLMWMASFMTENVDRGYVYLDHIAVDETFRGKGVGKALMVVADQQGRARQCHTIFLWVASDNRARNLYERQGYKTTLTRSGCCISCAIGRRSFDKMEKTL